MFVISKFSSPLRGSLISINKIRGYQQTLDSRPLYGGLLSQSITYMTMEYQKDILVPSTGVSYLNELKLKEKNTTKINSRPLYGGLLSQSCPLHLPKHKAFIPHLRGKPANERNLNIKLVYNILKA